MPDELLEFLTEGMCDILECDCLDTQEYTIFIDGKNMQIQLCDFHAQQYGVYNDS